MYRLLDEVLERHDDDTSMIIAVAFRVATQRRPAHYIRSDNDIEVRVVSTIGARMLARFRCRNGGNRHGRILRRVTGVASDFSPGRFVTPIDCEAS